MLSLFQKLLAILKQISLADLLKVFDAVQKFLVGEEAFAIITLKDGSKYKIIVDLEPLSLKVEKL